MLTPRPKKPICWGLAQIDFYQRLADECEQIALIGTRADLDGVLAS